MQRRVGKRQGRPALGEVVVEMLAGAASQALRSSTLSAIWKA